MSRVLENAFKEVTKSTYEFKDNGRTLVIENAYIFWTNFSGTPNKYGNAARTFNVAVNEEMAGILSSQGWRVREEDVVETDQVDPATGKNIWAKVYFVNIKLNMESAYPPVINLFTEFRGKKTKRVLDINTVGELDKTELRSCDIIINAYQSRNYEGKTTGYLKTMYAIQEPNIMFNGKYDDWENEDGSEALDAPFVGEENPY